MVPGRNKPQSFRGEKLSPQKGLFGDDGWFFLGNEFDNEHDQALGICSVDEASLNCWARSLRLMTEVLRRRGVESFFFLVPAKWSVYEDKLRLRDQVLRQKTSRQRLTELLEDSPVNFIDPTEEMRHARDVADTFSPLNSHWNNFGAFIAWQKLHQAIRMTLPHLVLPPIPPIAGFETIDNFNEAANIIGHRAPNPWHRPIFQTDFGTYDYILPGYVKSPQQGQREIDLMELPVITECQSAPNDARALIVRDSTGNQISPFIQTSFRSVLQHRHRYDSEATHSNILGPVRAFDPNLLVYLLTERYLIHNFLDAAYWEAANNFDLTSEETAAIWPKEHARPLLELFRSQPSGAPYILKVPCIQNSNLYCINISADCTSAGIIRVSHTLDSEVREVDFPVDATLNELFVEIPSIRTASSIEITGVGESSFFRIIRIEIRAQRH